MGIVRLYLALCVVADHAGRFLPWGMHSGQEAVQIFFVISGFYMALIQQKYSSVREFYASRFLRIFVPYWSLLVIIVSLCAIGGVMFHEWGELTSYVQYSPQRNGLAGVLLAAVSNITVFFQDAVMFISHDAGRTIQFTASVTNSSFPLYKYLVMPQAWSVGVELSFYLLVPVLALARTRTLILIMVVSFGLRAITYEYLGLANDPWSYRFFPFELACFVLGMTSCRLYGWCKARLGSSVERFQLIGLAKYGIYVLFAIVMFGLAHAGQRVLAQMIGQRYSVLASYVVWAALFPACFALSSANRLDRFIGELSYPVYLVHVFVIHVVRVIITVTGIGHSNVGLISATISVLAAVVLVTLIVAPLEKRRMIWARRMAVSKISNS